MATRDWPSYELSIANVTFNNLIRIFHEIYLKTYETYICD